MLIQCSKCGKIMTFGTWVRPTERLMEDSKVVPITKELCPACKAKEGGCPGLKDLRKRFTRIVFGDRVVGALIFILTVLTCWNFLSLYTTKREVEKLKHEYFMKQK